MFPTTFSGFMGLATASYLLASVVLFYFPLILHKKRKYNCPLFSEAIEDEHKILRIAHRGGSRVHMENTLEGFRRCMKEYKTDILEMDVCFTKDKKLVVHHDSSLIRTCGVQTHIEDLQHKDLPSFLPKVALDFAVKLHMEETSDLKIPLLEEVFLEFPNTPMNIQIKTPSYQAIEQFRRLIKTYKRESITVWGIRGPLHQTLKKPGEEVLTFFNDTQVLKLFLLYFTGLLPFFKIRDDSLQLPLSTRQFYQWKLDTNPDSHHKKIHYFFRGIKIMNWVMPPLIRHLRKRGIMTLLWVCNTEQDFELAVKSGCCGIMTDLPQLLDKYLDTREASHKKVV